MVGGPVFGPQPRLKQAAFAVVVFAAILAIVWLLVGCATHSYLYQPVPAYLIPSKPELQKVKAAELACLSDDVYERLANRDRIRQQYEDELRALLEPSDDKR